MSSSSKGSEYFLQRLKVSIFVLVGDEMASSLTLLEGSVQKQTRPKCCDENYLSAAETTLLPKWVQIRFETFLMCPLGYHLPAGRPLIWVISCFAPTLKVTAIRLLYEGSFR